jgi:hypothetical protein
MRASSHTLSPCSASAFDLPDHLAAKADPALIDARSAALRGSRRAWNSRSPICPDRLDAARKGPGGSGQEALDRDMEVHRLAARLQTLRRFGWTCAWGTWCSATTRSPSMCGRLGLTDSTGRRCCSTGGPRAEPFFGATHANPMGPDKSTEVPLDPGADQRLLG